MLFWARLVSGQSAMHTLGGRERLSKPLPDQAIDLAA